MILITGANRGVGAALLETYRAAGREALGTAREPAGDLLPLDVADAASVAALGERLAGKRIELLVCNAGIYPDRGMPLDTGFPAELWARMMATNVTGVFLTVQAMLPGLRAAAPSKIAIISSGMGSDARAGGGSYAYRASKAASLNIGRNLSVDLKSDGISVGIYHPGWVMTGMTRGTGANVPPEDSAKGLIARFDALGPGTTGCFETYEGQTLPF